MRDTLHWLPVTQRISFRIAAMFWRWLVGVAASYVDMYFRELCYFFYRLWWAVATRRSSSAVEILDPRVNASTVQRRVFSVAAPFIWNALPLEKRFSPRSNTPLFNLLNSHGLLRGTPSMSLEKELYKFFKWIYECSGVTRFGGSLCRASLVGLLLQKNAVERHCCI